MSEREGDSHSRIRGGDVEAVEPILRMVNAAPGGVLVWCWPEAVIALSSAAVGGGPSRPDWVLNIGVDSGYERTDLAAHADEVAAALDLGGHGVALSPPPTSIDQAAAPRTASPSTPPSASATRRGPRPEHQPQARLARGPTTRRNPAPTRRRPSRAAHRVRAQSIW